MYRKNVFKTIMWTGRKHSHEQMERIFPSPTGAIAEPTDTTRRINPWTKH
jgi:hypothetical protein